MNTQPIALQPVESSQLAAVGYNANTNTLAIRFKSGGLYHYSNVTPADFKSLMAAPSIGSYFYKNIKPRTDRFPFKKIEDSAAAKA